MQTIKINVTKIDKSALFDGKNGKYLDLVLFENKDGVDSYGNHGFVTQDIGKERRERGERGPILGNWKHVGGTIPAKPQDAHNAAKSNGYQPQADKDDDIPF
jgi:hypothetical protein